MRPLGSLPGNRVEIVQRRQSAAGAVVITAHVSAFQLFQTNNRLVRRRAVANDVAQVPHDVILWRSSQHGSQCLHVCVNVRKDERGHERGRESLLTGKDMATYG